MPTRWSSSAHLIIETHKTIIEYTWHLFIQEDFRQKPFRSCHQGSVSLEFCSNSSDSFSSYLRMSFSLSPSNEYSGLISFRIDWLDLLAVQRTLQLPFWYSVTWKSSKLFQGRIAACLPSYLLIPNTQEIFETCLGKCWNTEWTVHSSSR